MSEAGQAVAVVGAILLGCVGVGFVIFGGCVVALVKPGTDADETKAFLLGLLILIGGLAAIFGAVWVGRRAAAQKPGPPV